MGMPGGDGWVYAAREEGTPLIKIGCTGHKRVETRVRELCGEFHVSFTVAGAVKILGSPWHVEQALHVHLAAYRIQGEFFYVPMNQAIFQALVETVLPQVTRDLHAREVKRQAFLAHAKADPVFAARCFARSQRYFKRNARTKEYL